MAEKPELESKGSFSMEGMEGLSDNEDGPITEKKSVNELLSSEGKEGEDEALQRYKESLLGAAASGKAKSDDPRIVVIKELQLQFNGYDAIVIDMTKKENLEGPLSIQIKEGVEYRIGIKFVVQNELVSGLKYKNDVARGPLTVLKTREMLGSFGPDPSKEIEAMFPRRDWEEAPKGMMARGTYTCATTIVDDDKTEHLKFAYKMVIAKNF